MMMSKAVASVFTQELPVVTKANALANAAINVSAMTIFSGLALWAVFRLVKAHNSDNHSSGLGKAAAWGGLIVCILGFAIFFSRQFLLDWSSTNVVE